MFVDISQKKIVVIGAGKIATRRILALTDFASEMMVIAPEISEEIQVLKERGILKILQKEYEESDLENAEIVLVATNNKELNQQIGRFCQEKGILVNVASDKELCSFYFPGIVQKEDVVIGITASGKDHRKAREIREKISQNLDQWIE